MGIKKLSLMSRLRRVVKRVTILLNLNLNRWRLASMIGAASARRHHLSFNDRPGLRAACGYDSSDSEESSTYSSMGLRRAISYPSEDDIDKKAEMFIQNFQHQLQIERQISLELKYLRGNSFTSISP